MAGLILLSGGWFRLHVQVVALVGMGGSVDAFVQTKSFRILLILLLVALLALAVGIQLAPRRQAVVAAESSAIPEKALEPTDRAWPDAGVSRSPAAIRDQPSLLQPR